MTNLERWITPATDNACRWNYHVRRRGCVVLRVDIMRRSVRRLRTIGSPRFVTGSERKQYHTGFPSRPYREPFGIQRPNRSRKAWITFGPKDARGTNAGSTTRAGLQAAVLRICPRNSLAGGYPLHPEVTPSVKEGYVLSLEGKTHVQHTVLHCLKVCWI